MDLKNCFYDNGYYLLGTKKVIEDFIIHDDLQYEEYFEGILEDLNCYNDNDIIVINYENGMGYYYQVFTTKDKIEIK